MTIQGNWCKFYAYDPYYEEYASMPANQLASYKPVYVSPNADLLLASMLIGMQWISRSKLLHHWFINIGLLFVVTVPAPLCMASEGTGPQTVITLIQVIAGSKSEKRVAIRTLSRHWQDGYIPPLIELLRLNTDEQVRDDIVKLLQRKTQKRFGVDYQRWHRWSWSQNLSPIEHYAEFKAWLYGNIDPRFSAYFASDYASKIRLDEVLWGGVSQDGIPPLRKPQMITVDEASYLDDNNVIFAIEVNGDYRAYPKRIMGWHEMFVDTVGGVELVGVYCTLCGAMIVFETNINGLNHQLGTSGFLYRSNKLMYDKETQSLWNSFWGQPVIGPLVDEGISLKRRSVITTTWGNWRTRHPDTTVLSLQTGYDVDYGEGVAYKKYFASDELMFEVPHLDNRLENKAEVLGVFLSKGELPLTEPLAISAKYLEQNPIYYDKLDEMKIVILTDSGGANRVYEGDVEFETWNMTNKLTDSQGVTWTLTESALESPAGQKLIRIPAHRAFWFGWYSAFNNTRLVY